MDRTAEFCYSSIVLFYWASTTYDLIPIYDPAHAKATAHDNSMAYCGSMHRAFPKDWIYSQVVSVRS